jgi:DNA-binding CsgD family transcriptional regulator
VAHSGGSDNASSSRPLAGLTVREYLVLAASAAGLSVPEIAEEYGHVPETISQALVSAMAKLGARSELEAVAIARRGGLFDPSGFEAPRREWRRRAGDVPESTAAVSGHPQRGATSGHTIGG